jgi:hypothetical protein
MNDELEGRFRGLVEIICLYFLVGTEENHETLSQDSLCLGRDSNRAPAKHKSAALLLDCDRHCDLGVTICGAVYGEASEP